MRIRPRILAAAFTLPLLYAGDQAAVKRSESPAVPALRYTRETLDRIRTNLTAQIAARDASEGVMRAPTSEEAAALSGAAAMRPAVVQTLPKGGVALRPDLSQLEFVIVERKDDGALTIVHGTSKKSIDKGGPHVR